MASDVRQLFLRAAVVVPAPRDYPRYPRARKRGCTNCVGIELTVRLLVNFFSVNGVILKQNARAVTLFQVDHTVEL